MFKILMQYIPGNDQIWVKKLNEKDPIYEYDEEWEASEKAVELEKADPSGREYKYIL